MDEQSSTTDSRTPEQVVSDAAADLRSNGIKRHTNRDKFSGAVSALETVAYTQIDRAEAAESINEYLRRRIESYEANAAAVVYASRVAVQVAYVLGTSVIDVRTCGSSHSHLTVGDYEYTLYHGDTPSLGVSNSEAGMVPQRLPLDANGLTVAAYLQLCSVYGIRTSRRNTPAHLTNQVWESEPELSDMPDALKALFGLGGDGDAMSFAFPGGMMFGMSPRG